MTDRPSPFTEARWSSAARLVDVVRSEPGITRALAAQRLGIGSGSATDLVARMRRARLIDEAPAPAQGRGRPTTVLGAHPEGPLVLAADLGAHDWQLAVAGIAATPQVVARHDIAGDALDTVLQQMADAIATAHAEHRSRVRAVSVAVAGTVSGTLLTQFTARGWINVDLSVLTKGIPPQADIELLVGNDATLAGLAEARTGAAREAGTALHLIVAVGVGGTLVVGGEPVTGAHGAAGEYGHVPFGDPALTCPCGARGCWDLTIDGRALARLRGDPPPQDPVGYAYALVDRAPADGLTRRAFEEVAASLGRGIAGLVNLHDPDVVTLGGLAAVLRAAAPEPFSRAYRDGLMSFRKPAPPPVLDGLHGEEGPLYGAVARGLDHATTATALANWAHLQDR
jgi:predicted NBD/HSP70 family sugar kinase